MHVRWTWMLELLVEVAHPPPVVRQRGDHGLECPKRGGAGGQRRLGTRDVLVSLRVRLLEGG